MCNSGAGNGTSVEPLIAWFRDGCKEAERLAEQLFCFKELSLNS